MIVERRISVNVKICPQCPWAVIHAGWVTCDLKEKLKNTHEDYRKNGSIVGTSNIAEDCPIKLGRYPHCSK